MNMIISIPDDVANKPLENNLDFTHTMLLALMTGIRLPDNATNGYMIKIMFPTWEIDMEDAEDEEYPVVTCWIDKPNNIWTSFDLSWWNAKWEGVQEE